MIIIYLKIFIMIEMKILNQKIQMEIIFQYGYTYMINIWIKK